MKFNLTAFAVLLSMFSHSQSPDWQWAKRIGSIGQEYPTAIALDSSKNVYITGSFDGTVDFNPGLGVYSLTSIGNTDAFILKLDSLGNFIWAGAFGGTGYDVGNGITIDDSGNVYTIGEFSYTVDFDPGVLVYNVSTYPTTPGIETDVFIQKLDSNGNLIWAEALGGPAQDAGAAITTDRYGNVYSTGRFTNTSEYDPGPGTAWIGTSGSNIFISKLNSNGDFIWAKSYNTMPPSFYSSGRAIAVDTNMNVYTSGSIGGVTDFDPSAATSSPTGFGNWDIYVAKLDSLGNFAWAAIVGSTGTDDCFSLALDSAANVYTTGNFQGTADFNPGSGIYNLSVPAGFNNAVFIYKLSTAGNFVWAKSISGPFSNLGKTIAVKSSAVYTSGYFNGTMDMDPGVGTSNLTSIGSSSLFVSKLDLFGNFMWAKKAGGANEEQPYAIAVDEDGCSYVTAAFNSPTIQFDTTTLVNADNTVSSFDIAIVKLGNTVNSNIGIDDKVQSESLVRIFPNPFSEQTIIYFDEVQQKTAVIILDATGKEIKTIYFTGNTLIIDKGELQAGLYFIQVKKENKILTTKKIIIQ